MLNQDSKERKRDVQISRPQRRELVNQNAYDIDLNTGFLKSDCMHINRISFKLYATLS